MNLYSTLYVNTKYTNYASIIVCDDLVGCCDVVLVSDDRTSRARLDIILGSGELCRWRKICLRRKQGRIVHRSGKENKIIYKINKGEKGLRNI